MKPKDWDSLPEEEKRKTAMKLFSSMRGQYIIGQALAVAIDTMSKVKEPRKEISNIEDMDMLLQIFPLGRVVQVNQGLLNR